MGMSKLYTRTGDQGQTSLFDGTRVRKDDTRVRAYGAIDELNAHLGLSVHWAASRGEQPEMGELRARLCRIQRELFSLGADLATPGEGKPRDKITPISSSQIARIESWIDEASRAVPPLKSFVLPGGDQLACQLHICRTVCRRAERCAVSLAAKEDVNPTLLAYLNRLADLFFAWTRFVNHLVGVPEETWKQEASG